MNSSIEENILLAERLRNEDPEQFYTLVRMHLSFVLDLNTDDCDGNLEKKGKAMKWNLPFTKKQKLGTKSVTEGTVLTTEFIAQMQPVIEFLSKEENISQEGIFRRSGRVTRQQELKLLLHQGAELNFNDGQFSVHECATVLKNVLAELPESILTDAHYPAYCQIADLCGGKTPANMERLLRSIQLLILLLPNENRQFFQEIIKLLHLAVSHESKNRMSADNLATLFTPHLLCPRRLSPEALHTNSQVMSRVVAFMIQKGLELFEIPPTVATDVRAYWNKKEKRKLSSLKQMNESICDGTAANTVFTFVDRERTAQENQTNPTETALAQLYAYIQCLPESSKKRKLIKQFNKENGYGTPIRAGGKKRTKALNLGDSIKKHLSGFSKTAKRTTQQETVEDDDETNNLESAFPLEKIYNKVDVKDNKNNIPNSKHLLRNQRRENSTQLFDENRITSLNESTKHLNSLKFCEALTTSFREVMSSSDCTDATSQNNVLSDQIKTLPKKRNSSSPVKVSPCKSSRMSDELIVMNQLPVSQCAQQELHKWPVSSHNQQTESLVKFNFSNSFYGSAQDLSYKNNDVKECSIKVLHRTPRRAVSDHNLPEGFADMDTDNQFKTPVQRFNMSNLIRNTNNDGFLSSPNNTNRLPILYGPKNSFLMTTSTPAPGNGCLLTPIVDKNNSMSPITKSTKRMPKAMQETMMTPRSRKPVISLSGTDLCNLANTDSLESDESPSSKSKASNPTSKRLILDVPLEGENDSLSSTFRNYLFSRSVLTASPVDLSFSSRTDDFLSISETNTSEENENFKSLPEILNEAGLSESLLYCLDGNEPGSESGENDRGRSVTDCSCFFSDSDEKLPHVYETAL